jgi:hypothetical protein
MEARWSPYHVSQARVARGAAGRSRAIELATDYWPMPFALLVWVAVSELAWLGILHLAAAIF